MMSSGQAAGVLTASVALKRSRVESLELVRKLNCWGCNISDVNVLERLPNLEVLNLSCNAVTSLQALRPCQKLTELYVRKNRISDLRELEHLVPLSSLQVLWLSDNPVSQEPGYRDKVIEMLPQLKKLDNKIVSEEERMGSSAVGSKKTSNILAAVLCLLSELDSEGLARVGERIRELQES